ncbi:DUF1294 domain-containing protein [Aquibacillus salsiterrae]|uniref:DUF1294 domain-containing protein n=1 Tax=Aquibacillus salsiterrae TaxID=2950439 RepID=A0A9X3WES4_9BACI|nr:DUF1294 domain-containing protein [Aquibacillus salsiterrae]MDC3415726.1 DUF1294 domain-containing protein [Aquibacillus salsiterrae]
MIVCSYLLFINLFAYVLMGVDKKRAIRGKWRISENTLWLTAIIGGAIGSILGMNKFRHKTKHATFTYGMPFVLLLQLFLLVYLVYLYS